MNRLSAFFAELQTLLPDNPPYLVTSYQIMLVVAGFFVAWIILRWLLHFVKKRISRYEFIQINTQVFQLIRRAMFLAVVVKNFGDSSVDLQLRVWIDDARKRMRTISYITDRVKTAFDEQGIEIPYPKRDIYIKGKI